MTVERDSYDGGAAVAMLEERVFESSVTNAVAKPASDRASADRPKHFTIDLLGDWCKP